MGFTDRKRMEQVMAENQRQLEQRIASVTPPVTQQVKVGNPQTLNNNAAASIRKNGK